MRINGFEQIKAFYSWVFNNPDKVRPTHISLYLFLWNQGNRANWVEWFKCPYDLAMQGACIGNKGTYYKCLDELQSFKLIEYKKGLNNYKAPQIKLVKLYKSEPLNEQVTVPLSEPQTVPLTELLPVHIYKLITNNKELIIDKLKDWIDLEKEDNIDNENKIEFNVFWNLYDKKINTKWCKEKWEKLNFKTQQNIIDFIPKFLKTITDKTFQPHPKTFLNQQRWLDDIGEVKKEIPPFEFDFKKHGGDLNLFNKLKLEHERKYS